MSVLRKYGVATTITFPLIDYGAQDFEATPVTFASGDTQILKDEGTFANTGSNPAHQGNGIYSLALTATEMQAARIVITIIDTATKTWEDQAVEINTYGNASAEHAFDLDTAMSSQAVLSVTGAVGSVTGDVDGDIQGTIQTALPANTITATSIATDAITNAKIATDAIGASEIAANAITNSEFSITAAQVVADYVWDEQKSGHVDANSFGKIVQDLQDIYWANGGYENAAIWVDTVNGSAGATDWVNGTAQNPVNNWANALTLSSSLGLTRFRVLPGTSITLTGSSDNYAFAGHGYTIALGGQSISGASFEGATITGNDDGSNATATRYVSCAMGSNTLGLHQLIGCRLTGDLVLAEGADYFWDQCYSGVAGTGTPSVDLESAAETKNLSIRHYSGGMEFKNFGAGGGTHNASIEGHGQVVLNASCAGGTIAIRGAFTVTDNAGGAVTLSDDARLRAEMDVNVERWDGNVVSAGATNKYPDVNIASVDDDASRASSLKNNIDNLDAAVTTAATPAQVQTKLEDIHLDHLIGTADPGAVVSNDSIIAKLVSKSGTAAFSDYDNTTDSLQAQADAGIKAEWFIETSVSDAGPTTTDFDLASGLSATDNFYRRSTLIFTSGTLKGQQRVISTYTGASRNVLFDGDAIHVDGPWPTAPSNGDLCVIVGRG